MTVLKSSQLGVIVADRNTNPTLEASQLGLYSVSNPPIASALECSQLGSYVLVNNNKTFLPMPPPFNLGCWSPCGVLAYNGVR